MKQIRCLIAIAFCVLALGSCQKDHPYPGLDPTGMFGADFISRNSEFEEDWSSAKTITLVTDNYSEGGKTVVRTIEVPLPWASDQGPQQWLPQYTAENMATLDKDDWRLVFNLTGIDEKPGEHFFGLYNRYTGKLRVFYYITEDRLPSHDGNDHMWSMAFTKDILEHVNFQFAIPYGEKLTDTYKNTLGGDDSQYRTTSLTNACTNDGKVVPAIGWWAYDIDMSPMRDHDFFESTRSVMRPGMLVSNEDNVVLTSLLKGSLSGSFGGNMNLNSLKGSSTNTAGIIVGILGGGAASFFPNAKVLEDIGLEDFTYNSGWALFGNLMGIIGKGMEAFIRDGVQDPDKLGDFNGSIDLALDATIQTVGTIGGARTSLVPSPNLNVNAFFKSQTPDGKPTGLGSGVWNIEQFPVVYVIKDAYWGDMPKFSSVAVQTEDGRKAHKLTIDPDRVGLRYISFLDPTSIGRVYVNQMILPDQVEKKEVRGTYGVFNAAQPGYTQGFRTAIGLDYENPKLTDKEAFESDESGLGFVVIKKSHSDALFLDKIDEDQEDMIGHRLSQQQITENIHRRMFGTSYFYSNSSAGMDQVDEVAMVDDPQVYLPVDSKNRLLFDTEVPDYVVGMSLKISGKDSNGEETVLFHTLRFLPRIKFISLSEVQGIYDSIVERSAHMPSQEYDYPLMEEQLEKIRQLISQCKGVEIQ